ncbi:Mus7/MMS22 family-domain-containing protein [Sphaerosporella brunnea]|uniref:Mus7/MMS22 family-domain-containing protein n=1 Tax=Sphaerosporella brunnea TaxID=1250544 RepID=A0A5J5EJN3_9PEZI|nr:Mus7/MMS22 family-domain-containing protein [Sphaerosporella brunnea]
MHCDSRRVERVALCCTSRLSAISVAAATSRRASSLNNQKNSTRRYVMTTWRELGYVPASDGEDSEAELSTQEDDFPVPGGTSIEVTTRNADERMSTSGFSNPVETPPELLLPTPNDGFMDLDGVEAATQNQSSGKGSQATATPDEEMKEVDGQNDDFMDIDEALGVAGNRMSTESSRFFSADIPVLDLSHQQDEEDGGTDLEDCEVRRTALTAHARRSVSSSPDPLTGEPQHRLLKTPIRQKADHKDDRQIPETSSVTSSPLSSAPPSPARTVVIASRRDSTPPPSSAPPIEETSPFFQRNLRQRKPIQKHPYLIEAEKYKRQMKEKGVQPVRILPEEEEGPRRTTGEDKDSQDTEYVAPSSPVTGEQPRRRQSSAAAAKDARDEFVEAVYAVERRRRLKELSTEGAKRRKLEHTYSKKTSGHASSSIAARSAGAADPISSLARGTVGLDIYDFPDSSPPIQRNTNSSPPPAGVDRPVIPTFLEDWNDSDVEALRDASPVTKSPVAQRARSISMSPTDPTLHHSEEPANGNDEEDAGSGSDSQHSNESGSEDSSQERDPRSKVVKFFKKHGTKGVLPASYIRFAEKLKPTKEKHEDTRRRRGSTSPLPEERRPGVARAKISSRFHAPVQDLFSQSSDSDSESDLLLAASAPTASKRQARNPGSSAPPRRVINLIDDDDDIPEDNRIDYGLPAQKRRNSGAPRAKRNKPINQSGSALSRARAGGLGRSSGNKTSKRRNPRQSSGPRLSIVDSAAHLKKSGVKSPPNFLKVAVRSAQERKDCGRQSPAMKLFVLETADDTREVQDVLRNWREGTLPFGRHQIDEHERIPGNDDAQARLSSPQCLDSSQSGRLHSRPQSFLKSSSSRPKARQTSLFNHDFQRTTAGRQNVPRPWAQTRRPLAVIPPKNGVITHRPAFAPQPAQFEREIPRSQHRTELVIENVIRNLHYQRSRQLASKGFRTSNAVRTAQSPATRTALPLQYTLEPIPPQEQPPARQPATTRRKFIPRRIDADTIERRQPPVHDTIVDDGEPFEPIIIDDHASRDCLSGLLPAGSTYSLNFDTSNLKDGTIFNAETFIGQGYLSMALKTQNPRISSKNQGTSFTFGGKSLSWGAYHDSVATDFEGVLAMIGDLAEKRSDDVNGIDNQGMEGEMFALQAYKFYGFVVKYISEIMTFHDPLDAVSFSQRFLQSLGSCCSRLSLNVSGPSDTTGIAKKQTRLVLQANAFCLVVALQILRLSTLDIQEQLDMSQIIRKLGRELISRLLRCGVDRIRACYDDQRRRVQFERGIGSNHYIFEIWVLAIQILDSVEIRGISFWEILNHELHIDRVESSNEIKTYERLWRNLFTLLPLYQFDDSGISRRIESCHVTENWSMTKILAGRPLRVYNLNKGNHSGSINDYVRIIYHRCYCLIATWCWNNPDSIIPVLFEFFASNSLSNLPNEDDGGSPSFLLNLDKNPRISVEVSDRCFHLLLKIIVIGLNRMKSTSTTRKISGLVYRLMPNHRRQYPKDEELRVEHLDALKNHHYLLETLHWAAPPDCRPPLDAIRLLVDPETSHQKACNVAVRAWQNLIRFQLNSAESLEPLRQLMTWFDDLTNKTLAQHQIVRSEAEKQFQLAKEQEDSTLSEEDLEENVRRNQKQLETILNDLVKSLRTELTAIPGQISSAMVLLTLASTANILGSYTRLPTRLLIEVLDLLQQFLKTCKPVEGSESQRTIAPVNNNDEDSQDYGDWSGFEEVALQDETKQAAEHFISVAYDSLHRMLSNCFGADWQPEEMLLVKLVDTWTQTAGFLVQYGLKKWDDYLEYSRESWSSLRDTAQTRKFTPYFLPKIILAGNDVYNSNRSAFLGFWLRSLVERESMLKFQNEFTATLLDCDPGNPILSNLPFERDPRTGIFKISQMDFRIRRLSLISSVFEKMRETYKAASGHEAAALKQEYARMLRGMMRAMRENFEVLQSSTGSGNYVDFVHKVVEFLLQYTADIVEIDRFFTDSSAFPLPASDPNYVVGQLKKYVFGLSFPGTQKQLNVFFQTLGERAALGNEQDRLVSQLSSALSEDFESGDRAKPTMRSYFLHAIFTSYVELALEHPAGWVFGIPIIKALRLAIADLRMNMDSTNPASMNSVLSMLSAILDSMRRAASKSMTTDDAFSVPHIIGTLTLLLHAFVQAITLLGWIYDDTDEELRANAKDCADFLIRFASYARKIVMRRRNDDEAQRPLDVLAMSDRPQSAFEIGRQHCKATLKAYLSARWSRDGDGWLIQDMGGAGKRAVSFPRYPGEEDESARSAFGMAVEEVLRVAARTELFVKVVKDVDRAVWRVEATRAGRRPRLEMMFC